MLRKEKAGDSRLTRTLGIRRLLGLALLAVLVFIVPVAGSAQTRRVEVFGMLGANKTTVDIAEDPTGNLSIDTGASYGAALMIPLLSSLALDVDIQSASQEKTFALLGIDLSLKTRETLISPSLVWRKGTDRVYFFIGAGVGLNALRMTSAVAFINPINQESITQNVKVTSNDASLNIKLGVVGALTDHFLIRGDALVVGASDRANVTARFGVGYRF